MRIKYGRSFNKPINNLPDSVCYIDLEESQFEHPINKYPKKLKSIYFPTYYPHKIKNLADSIKKICIPEWCITCSIFSTDIIYLKIYNNFVDIFEDIFYTSILPKTLEFLTLGYRFNHTIHEYPPNLRYLEFSKLYNQETGNIPDTVKSLIFGNYYDKKIMALPENLEYLEFGNSYDVDLPDLPSKLHTLKFGKFYNKNINAVPSIKKLYIGERFRSNILNLSLDTIIYVDPIKYKFVLKKCPNNTLFIN